MIELIDEISRRLDAGLLEDYHFMMAQANADLLSGRVEGAQHLAHRADQIQHIRGKVNAVLHKIRKEQENG